MGQGWGAEETLAGRWATISPRRRQLTAKALTSRSSRVLNACSAPWQKAPTPVGWPRSGVASSDTRSLAGIVLTSFMNQTGSAPVEPCTHFRS